MSPLIQGLNYRSAGIHRSRQLAVTRRPQSINVLFIGLRRCLSLAVASRSPKVVRSGKPQVDKLKR